jgi:uncharacterized protein (TIGR04222 family)
LTYPAQAALLEQPTLDWNFDAAWKEDRIILTASDIAEDEDLILTAKFARDSITQVTPQWQIQKQQRDVAAARALPAGFLAGIATLVLGSLGLLTYIRANGRDLTSHPVVSTPSPPGDVSPALVGKLANQPHSFMGAIFDLAQRGVLEVQQENGFWGLKNHILVLKETNIPLKPHEQGLLDALFERSETRINMNEVPARLAAETKLFDEPLEQELTQRGWLDLQRKQKRTLLVTAGVLIMLVTIVLFVGALIMGVTSSSSLNLAILFAIIAGIGAGLFLLSMGLLIYGASFSILTPLGEEQLARWKGFAEYLKQVGRGREPVIRPDYFERYLAYAAVFGLGAKWAKYFQDRGGVPLPVWFHAAAGHGDFGAIVAMMSTSDSAGAGGAGGGGGGASGGGSSGAG